MEFAHKKKNLFLFSLSFLIALLLHAAALYLLYDAPLPTGMQEVKKSLFLTAAEHKNEKKKENDKRAITLECFTQMEKLPPEKKEVLAELSTEFAPPPPLLSLPDLKEDLFAQNVFAEEPFIPALPLSFEEGGKEQFLEDYMAFNKGGALASFEKALIGMQGEVAPLNAVLDLKGFQIGRQEDLPNLERELFSSAGCTFETQKPISSQELSFEAKNIPPAMGTGNLPEICPPPLAEAPQFFTPYKEESPRSDFFDLAVEVAPKRSRPGYVFKITLTPKKEIVFKRMPQNYFFLLDRSNSIARYRYQKMRRAVFEALSTLQAGDSFNIVLFDDKVVRLSPSCLPWSPDNVAKARNFLERYAYGGVCASADLYASLSKIFSGEVKAHGVNTAILFSDGDTFLSRAKQREIVGEWTKKNNGEISLFSIASGTGNNLTLLELLTNLNKGKLIYAPRHELIKERLFQLIKTIKNPIGKSLVLTAVAPDKKTHIILQPKNYRLPDLYHDRPFTIYGSTNRLSDFALFVQGRYLDQFFDIKKTVTFKKALPGTLSLEREWTQLLAQDCLEKFFHDGKESHLDSAKQLLGPLNFPML